MGIGGSIVDQGFFESYLGIRVEAIDMVEFIRRLNEDIYDPVEFEKAMAWVKENCKEGQDVNPEKQQRTREQKDADWEVSVKMTMIARDLMVGNPELEKIGYGEEALGHNGILGGFHKGCPPRTRRQVLAGWPGARIWGRSLGRTGFWLVSRVNVIGQILCPMAISWKPF